MTYEKSPDISYCKYCNEYTGDILYPFATVGQYGMIALAHCACAICGYWKYRNRIIDNSGNIPPNGNR